MTTLYKDIARNQLIYVDNYDPNKQAELYSYVNLTYYSYKAKNKSDSGFIQKIDEWAKYIDSYFNHNRSLQLYQTFRPMSASLTDPLYTPTWIVNTAVELSKKAGLTPNTDKYGAKIRYYEFESNGQEFEQLTTCHNQKGNSVLFCVTKEEGITECELTVYPHFEEEVKISNLSYNLLTQCSAYNKELYVPLKEGSIVVLSDSTFYSLHRIKGKGKCYIIIVKLYSD